MVDPFSIIAGKALGQVCCMIQAHEPYFGIVSVPASALIRQSCESPQVTCGICADILHKSVALIPCLHNFCAPSLGSSDSGLKFGVKLIENA